MEEDFIKKLTAETHSVKLDTSERVSARENLLLFMKENPIPKPTKPLSSAPVAGPRVRSPYVPSWFASVKRIPVGAIALVVVLVIAGISYTAEGALPGDALYAVKTGFNERVGSALTFGVSGDVSRSSALLDRRISEGEALAVQGKLGQSVSASLERSLVSEVQSISSGIATLQKQGDYTSAVSLSTDAEVKIKTHQAILSELALAKTDSVSNDVSTFLFAVEGHRSALQALKLSVATALAERTDPNIETAALSKLKSTEEQLANAEKQAHGEILATASVQKDSASATPSPASVRTMGFAAATAPVNEPQDKVTLARKAHDQGNAFFQAGQYGRAYVLFEESAKLLEEDRLMREASLKFNLTVSVPSDSYVADFARVTIATTTLPAATTTPKVSKPAVQTEIVVPTATTTASPESATTSTQQ